MTAHSVPESVLSPVTIATRVPIVRSNGATVARAGGVLHLEENMRPGAPGRVAPARPYAQPHAILTDDRTMHIYSLHEHKRTKTFDRSMSKNSHAFIFRVARPCQCVEALFE